MSEEYDEQRREGEARVGAVLAGKWTLERVLGVGGMATVYEATHRNGAKAALKILHGALVTHPEALERFRREAQIANKVGHAGVAKVLDDDVTPQGEPFLVMELLHGESVEQRAERNGGRLPLSEVLTIADRTLAVLEAAHAKGIVHRDLKPENLFLTREGELKLLDFGIARLREGGSAKRTRTGIMMGTPAFMAPEQALGRWSEVDARTDLWAMGAVMFTLITGRGVHAGDTVNEVVVNAATRPASSIARVAQLPTPVVRLVDRALQFDAHARFQDATSMREALREASGAASGAPTTGAESNVAAHAPTLAGVPSPSVRPPPQRPKPIRRDDDDAEVDFDTSFATPEDIEALSELFTYLERALSANTRYGLTHPEAERQLEVTLARCSAALSATETALVWNVTPYGFSAAGEMVWEPRVPFDRIPYQLFADGVRLMGLLPGLDAREFRTLVKIITADRAKNMAPEDDFVTLLWEADLPHVAYQAVDAFVEGDQAALSKFESDQAAIVALANFDTSFQLEDCWQDRDKSQAIDPEEAKRALLARLAGTDVESRLKAESLATPGIASPFDRGALTVADEIRAALSAQLVSDTRTVGERLALSVALAWGEVATTNAAGSVSAPLAAAFESLATTSPPAAFALFASVRDAFGRVHSDHARAESLRGSLAGAMVTARAMKVLLQGATTAADREPFVTGLELVFGHADDTHVNAAIDALRDLGEPRLVEVVLAYLGRVGKGHEARMGAAFAEADLDLALALIRALTRIGTNEAKAAILRATSSPFAVVRIEALSHLEGVASERMRMELKALLEDREVGVRVAALRTIAKHQIRAAGPSLVMRIRSSEFDKLGWDEKRMALEALTVLAPNRAEAVCLELLAEAPLVSNEAHEQTRVLAAETLGTFGASPEVLDALGAAASSRWRSSERVRATAGKAKEQVEIRISRPPPGSKRP